MQSELLSQGYFLAFASVFVGGFLTSLTPCVYPLISVTVGIFGARGEEVPRGRAMLLAGCYVGGIALTYTALGVAFALTGRAFQFGSFLGDWRVVAPIAILLIAMAASMFGAFELNLPTGLQQRLTQVGGRGFLGAFLMGTVGGIIAAPCTGPVLASILALVATARSPLLGGSLLFTYALGMGILFFVVAAFARALPKSGAWMEGIKRVFGALMIVAALYFLRNVWPALAVGPKTMALLASALGAIALGLAVNFLVGRAKIPAVLLLIGGGYGAVAWALASPPSTGLSWVMGESAGVAAARASSRPAFLDFFADWCLPCKEMELKTFHHPEVAAELQRFTLVKVDCTSDEDPQVAATQKKYAANTLPTLVLLDRDGKVAKKIDHYVEPPELLEALRAVR